MKTETRRAKRERRSALQSERLGEQFQKRLASYAAAAGAAGVGILALAPPAQAKIVYIPLHEQFGLGLVSLNVDGTSIITFEHYISSSIAYLRSFLSASGYGVEAAPLRKGTPIGFADHFSARVGLEERSDFAGTYGAWVNVNQRYLGFEFKLNGQVHYGWARLTVRNEDGYSIVAVLNGYAYNTVAGQLILAGQTSADPAIQVGPEALANRAAPHLLAEEALRPGSLGLLALGSPGLDIWRPRKQELTPA